MDVQAHDVSLMMDEMNRLGWPPHQAMFYDGRRAIAAAGIIQTEKLGVFFTWIIHGKNMKKGHYHQFPKFFKDYINKLEWRILLHIIDKRKPWTKKMAALYGFSYISEVDSNKELWGMSNGH